jgi:hypothetical protein
VSVRVLAESIGCNSNKSTSFPLAVVRAVSSQKIIAIFSEVSI